MCHNLKKTKGRKSSTSSKIYELSEAVIESSTLFLYFTLVLSAFLSRVYSLFFLFLATSFHRKFSFTTSICFSNDLNFLKLYLFSQFGRYNQQLKRNKLHFIFSMQKWYSLIKYRNCLLRIKLYK